MTGNSTIIICIILKRYIFIITDVVHIFGTSWMKRTTLRQIHQIWNIT